MKRLKKFLIIAVIVLVALFIAVIATLRIRYGGGQYFPDRSGAPSIPASSIEVVANLDFPPGNIAVSNNNRILFSFHPDGKPTIKVAELINGQPVPYPDKEFQQPRSDKPYFHTVLAVRIDSQNRFWTLDHGDHGQGQPRLLAFDLNTNQMVHQFDFPAEICGLGSMLNDMQIAPDGTKIYIAEASIFRLTPAIIVYDTVAKQARRLLDSHASVQPGNYIPRVQGQDMVMLGIFTIKPGVDSIALDKRGEWLYYAAVTNENIYRIKTADLNNTSLDAAALASKVETYAAKTMSDGISIDLDNNLYLTDLEHSALISLGPDKNLRTLVKDEKLRWPDGLSFGPDNWLYMTCSSLQHVILKSASHVKEHGPYQIFRFKPGPASVPGQ